MRLKFYGTRGSIPICDASFQQFGGNTTCLQITFTDTNRIAIIDAGTGLRNLGKDLRVIGHKQDQIVIAFTHFHWDHIQGNQAYRAAVDKIDFIASEPTKQLMSDLAQQRLQASLDEIPKQIDALRVRAGKSSSADEKAFCEEQIRQMLAYQSEMKTFTLQLPTITFGKSYLIKDEAHELHLEFHGHAHTAGDVVIFCPQKRVVATGDMIHGFLPFIRDAFPKTWPKTMDAVAQLGFDRICPGHGPVHQSKGRLIDMRNYIEELTEKVEAGKKAGQSIADLQKTITVASLKSMQSNGYSKYVSDNQYKYTPNFGPATPLQDGINTNIVEVFNNLERM